MRHNRCTLFFCAHSNKVWTGLTTYFSFNYWDTFLPTLGCANRQQFKEDRKKTQTFKPKEAKQYSNINPHFMLFIHLVHLVINTTRVSVVQILQQNIFFLIAYFMFPVFDRVKDKLDTREKKNTWVFFLGSSILRSEARECLSKEQRWSQRKDQGRC